jgi:hypothetical protein
VNVCWANCLPSKLGGCDTVRFVPKLHWRGCILPTARLKAAITKEQLAKEPVIAKRVSAEAIQTEAASALDCFAFGSQ